MEISPDGKTLKPRSRFSKFVNLPELQQMFRTFADVQTAEMLNLPRPRLATGKPIVVARPMSDDQQALQQELVARYERLRSQKVDPREDNALAITTDGRKLALDARMVSPTAARFPDSKMEAMLDKVVECWHDTAAKRSTQMIFADMGVNPTPWGYSAYDEIIAKLVARGIPRTQIVTIGDADSDAKKRALFDQVRSGQVRILIGSTTKMGTGTNVQKRLVALHELDAPWKPAEVEQREGRILRQGNENDEVAIYRYVTQGSFDSFMWQALETKARFINQIMTNENAARRAEDIGGQELSYAEVKAIASGNPAVLTLAEADAELQRLSILKRNHHDEQFLARRHVRELPGIIERRRERLSGLTTDMETVAKHTAEGITVGGRLLGRNEAIAVLGEQMESMPNHVMQTRRVPLGSYRGLRFGILLNRDRSPDVFVEGAGIHDTMLSRDHPGPRTILNALDRIVGNFRSESEWVRRELSLAETQLRDYQTRLDKPFAHGAYLRELESLRDQLKAGLTGRPGGEKAEEGPTVSELAERIKMLKAGNMVEPVPQRSSREAARAEEPVTARIRRRAAVAVPVDTPNENRDVDVPNWSTKIETSGSTRQLM